MVSGGGSAPAGPLAGQACAARVSVAAQRPVHGVDGVQKAHEGTGLPEVEGAREAQPHSRALLFLSLPACSPLNSWRLGHTCL